MRKQRQFHGQMGDEYDLIRSVMPHFDKLQRLVGIEIARLASTKPKLLEIGCGDGITTKMIIHAKVDSSVIAIDNEQKMIMRAKKCLRNEIQSGRCEVVFADALQFTSGLPNHSLDAVASALTLHNLPHAYRRKLHRQIYRVLKPGGRFVNADKYAPQNDIIRFTALGIALERFFKTFLDMRKYRLLQEWVLHNVADQGPDRVMKENDTIKELREIGFINIRLGQRNNMEAVLVALKKS